MIVFWDPCPLSYPVNTSILKLARHVGQDIQALNHLFRRAACLSCFLVLGPTNFEPTFGAHRTHFEGLPAMAPKKNTRTYPSDADEVEKPAFVDANRKGKVTFAEPTKT